MRCDIYTRTHTQYSSFHFRLSSPANFIFDNTRHCEYEQNRRKKCHRQLFAGVFNFFLFVWGFVRESIKFYVYFSEYMGRFTSIKYHIRRQGCSQRFKPTIYANFLLEIIQIFPPSKMKVFLWEPSADQPKRLPLCMLQIQFWLG